MPARGCVLLWREVGGACRGRCGGLGSQGPTFRCPSGGEGAMARAQHCLDSSGAQASDPHVSAPTACALTLLRGPAAPAALRKLRGLAFPQGRCPPPATPEAAVGVSGNSSRTHVGSKEASFACFVYYITHSLLICFVYYVAHSLSHLLEASFGDVV